MAKRVESLLKDKGIEVVMTRTSDVYPSLKERVQIGVNSGSDAFVSIHGNAAGASASGTETFYSSNTNRAGDSKQLATFIQNRLYKAMDTRNRGVKDKDFYVSLSKPATSCISGIRIHDKCKKMLEN